MNDDRDFVALCVRHRPDMLRVAINLTRNKADAEDLVQRAYLRAMRSWDGFRGMDKEDFERVIRAWLFTIVRNEFINTMRHNKRQRAHLSMSTVIIEVTYGKQEGEHTIDISKEPADLEMSDTVKNALKSLRKSQREILVRHANGQKYTEIAASLGIPMGTVMSRLHRARKELAEILRSYAASEYGIGKAPVRSEKRNRGAVASAETTECEQSEPYSVDAIVGGDDDGEFVGAEGDTDTVATW